MDFNKSNELDKKDSKKGLITKENMLEIIKKENLKKCGFSIRF